MMLTFPLVGNGTVCVVDGIGVLVGVEVEVGVGVDVGVGVLAGVGSGFCIIGRLLKAEGVMDIGGGVLDIRKRVSWIELALRVVRVPSAISINTDANRI